MQSPEQQFIQDISIHRLIRITSKMTEWLGQKSSAGQFLKFPPLTAT
uniref:Uncharacterized protein n=1 Tax=Setaria italica TaxID=4555 RepID=K3ZGA0_SETIT